MEIIADEKMTVNDVEYNYVVAKDRNGSEYEYTLSIYNLYGVEVYRGVFDYDISDDYNKIAEEILLKDKYNMDA